MCGKSENLLNYLPKPVNIYGYLKRFERKAIKLSCLLPDFRAPDKRRY